MALAWSPSVDAARTEDTVVIDSRGYEVVTAPPGLAADRRRRQGLHHPPARHPRTLSNRAS